VQNLHSVTDQASKSRLLSSKEADGFMSGSTYPNPILALIKVQAIPLITGPRSMTNKYRDGDIGSMIKPRVAQILSFERLEDLSRQYNNKSSEYSLRPTNKGLHFLQI
jgi:hypothetical protein